MVCKCGYKIQYEHGKIEKRNSHRYLLYYCKECKAYIAVNQETSEEIYDYKVSRL